MIKRKPGDMNRLQDEPFNWDVFVHNLTNGSYILLLGSEVMLSKELGMNRTYLCKLFTEETGFTINQYVTQVKMEKLQKVNMSIVEV